MLGVFSSSIVSPPGELVAAGSRTPSPKTTSDALIKRFLETNPSAVSVEIGDHVQLAYTHHNESPLHPRSFAAKDEIFCLFEGMLENLGRLRQQYGLAKTANEVTLVIEAYKALRDRAPYPPDHVVGHLDGDFAFMVFDKSTDTLFVASDQFGKVPLYWGITADGYVAFADNAELLKGACGKSLASFPQGCFYSTAIGEIRSFENPKGKVTAIPASDEEMWGATFKVSTKTRPSNQTFTQFIYHIIMLHQNVYTLLVIYQLIVWLKMCQTMYGGRLKFHVNGVVGGGTICFCIHRIAYWWDGMLIDLNLISSGSGPYWNETYGEEWVSFHNIVGSGY